MKNTPHFDKQKLREALITLERAAIAASQTETEQAVQSARIDRSVPLEHQAHADATTSAQLAAQWHVQLHTHEEHLQLLQRIDFSGMTEVDRGALVKVNGRWMVLAVPTEAFEFDGELLIGISCEAPLAQAMHGLRAGDQFVFNGNTQRVEVVL